MRQYIDGGMIIGDLKVKNHLEILMMNARACV